MAPLLELPTGRYEVQAQLGFVVAKGVVDAVVGAPRSLGLVLGAGIVQLAEIQPASPEVWRDAIVTFSRSEAAAETVALLRGIEREVVLAPGTYQVAVTTGPLRIDRKLVVRAGERTQLDPQLNFGVIELNATAAAGGGPLEQVLFTLHEDDPEFPAGAA